MVTRAKKDPTAWQRTPAGDAAYRACRAEAQSAANTDGFDRGLEANDIFHTFRHFMLPNKAYRAGYELRCEVVSCETPSKCQHGHGPGSAFYVGMTRAVATFRGTP
jgi:hypothetical protein